MIARKIIVLFAIMNKNRDKNEHQQRCKKYHFDSMKLIGFYYLKKSKIYYKNMQQQITSKYNTFLTKGGNLIWAGAMCLAWNNLKQTFTSDPLVFYTQRPDSLKTIQNFNHSTFSLKDIDEKSYYVKAGFGNQTQALINKQVKLKFPNFSFSDLNYKLKSQDIISFAYLYKQLKFTHKFERMQQGNFLFNGIPVQSFCATNEQQRKQIHVVQYKNNDNFCLEIKDEKMKDSLFLIKNSKIKTVDQAIIFTQKNQKSKMQRTSLTKRDYFQMPVIEIDCGRDYLQMLGLKFKNSELKAYQIGVMYEALKLKIDQSGAKIENKAVIVAQKGKVLNKQQPRYFILDKTFWIVMKQPKKHPYLCVKITNPFEKS